MEHGDKSWFQALELISTSPLLHDKYFGLSINTLLVNEGALPQYGILIVISSII
jgi:hypothetical protein